MRRKRFTVTDTSGRKTVVLAYSAENAYDWCERRRGIEVESVVAGDYRTASRTANVRASGRKFAIDYPALREACSLLDIDLPVKVRLHSKVGNTHANHRFNGTFHNIMLKSYLTAAEASSALWHELTHAMQAERAGGTKEAWNAYRAKNGSGNYHRRPIEVEARQMQADMADIPLTYEI